MNPIPPVTRTTYTAYYVNVSATYNYCEFKFEFTTEKKKLNAVTKYLLRIANVDGQKDGSFKTS